MFNKMVIPTNGGGDKELTVLVTSRANDPNKAYSRTFNIPKGIKNVIIVWANHTGSTITYPTITYNGTSITADKSTIWDYGGGSYGGFWYGAYVDEYTLDGNGGDIVVSFSAGWGDSICIY